MSETQISVGQWLAEQADTFSTLAKYESQVAEAMPSNLRDFSKSSKAAQQTQTYIDLRDMVHSDVIVSVHQQRIIASAVDDLADKGEEPCLELFPIANYILLLHTR